MTKITIDILFDGSPLEVRQAEHDLHMLIERDRADLSEEIGALLFIHAGESDVASMLIMAQFDVSFQRSRLSEA